MTNSNLIKDEKVFVEDVSKFFKLFFEKPLEKGYGQIDISTFPKGGFPDKNFYGDILEAVKASLEICNMRENVYFGVNPRVGEAARKENIHYVSAFYVDIDCGQIGHKQKSDYETTEKALEVVKKFEHQPTTIVHTGGGLHLYWVLKEPKKVDDVGYQAIENINKYLVSKLGGDNAATDISRVLRVPCTFNVKVEDNPREAEILKMDGPKYDYETFEKYSTFKSEKGEKKSKLASQKTIKQNVKNKRARRNTECDEYVKELYVSDKIKNLIMNGNDGSYPSRSEADMAVVSELYKKGYEYEEIKNIFESYPIGEKYAEHTSPSDYLKHTVKKAKELCEIPEEDRKNPLIRCGAIVKDKDGKIFFNIVEFQEYIRKKYKLIFQGGTNDFFRYNEKCYEICGGKIINWLCQKELGGNRKLFTALEFKHFLHYGAADCMIEEEILKKDQEKYLTLENGLFDLENQKLIPHTDRIFTINLLPYNYDPRFGMPDLAEIFGRCADGRR